jgi:hypothetical protein
MAALCALGGLFVIDADMPSTEVDKRVDWLGAALVTSALVLLLFVLGQCQLAPHGWRTPCAYRALFTALRTQLILTMHV